MVRYTIKIIKKQPVYTISVAAEIIGCHPRTLRIYEEEGLVHPSRTRTNLRRYSQEDIEQIQNICRLMETMSLNLAGIKALLLLAKKMHWDMDDVFEKLLGIES
jgi:MerR family transcriptional regulator/heat shock protein HspR